MATGYPDDNAEAQSSFWLELDGKLLSFSKGEFLFAQGADVENMYFLQSGGIRLLRHTPEGDKVILHTASAGELIAEASLFSDHYHCSAITDYPSRVYSLPRRQLLHTLSTRAKLSLQVLKTLSQQIRDLRGLLEIRNIRSAEQRILAYLRSRADPGGRVALTLSLRDTAYKLGLAHETLYRALRKLENHGLIERPQARTVILKQ